MTRHLGSALTPRLRPGMAALRAAKRRQTTPGAYLATALALVLCAPAGAQQPYEPPRVAAADNGEVAVAWTVNARGAGRGIQAAIGTPGQAFGEPVTIAAPTTSWMTGSTDPLVHMDAAGNVIVVWEAFRSRSCYKADCVTDSLGVFASVRPAQGPFRAPLRLSGMQLGRLASPLLAMNRNGDWVVVMWQGARQVIAAGKGATPPSTSTAIGVAGMRVTAVALDEVGNATLAGADAANQPATVTRHADGSAGELVVLDDVELAGRIAIDVGPSGQAVAAWEAGGRLRSATRPAGGRFGSVMSTAPDGFALLAVAVDGRDGTVMLLSKRAAGRDHDDGLLVARGTVRAAFGAFEALSDAGRDVIARQLAVALGGNSVLDWLQSSAPLKLTPPGDAVRAAMAIDGTGRVALAWARVVGDVEQIVASGLTPVGVSGPTVVAQSPASIWPLTRVGGLHAPAHQELRVQADRTIRPWLRCVSSGPKCRGVVVIDSKHKSFRKRTRVGAVRFVLAAGRSRRVTVRVTRAALRAARRGALECVIRTQTASDGGLREDSAWLTLRARPSY